MTKFTLKSFNGPTTVVEERLWDQTFGKRPEKVQVLRCETHDELYDEGKLCPKCAIIVETPQQEQRRVEDAHVERLRVAVDAQHEAPQVEVLAQRMLIDPCPTPECSFSKGHNCVCVNVHGRRLLAEPTPAKLLTPPQVEALQDENKRLQGIVDALVSLKSDAGLDDEQVYFRGLAWKAMESVGGLEPMKVVALQAKEKAARETLEQVIAAVESILDMYAPSISDARHDLVELIKSWKAAQE